MYLQLYQALGGVHQVIGGSQMYAFLPTVHETCKILMCLLGGGGG